jgi:hypothetical protein
MPCEQVMARNLEHPGGERRLPTKAAEVRDDLQQDFLCGIGRIGVSYHCITGSAP